MTAFSENQNHPPSPWVSTAVAFGVVVSFFYIAKGVPGLPRESAEWVFWALVAFAFPPLFFIVQKDESFRARRAMLGVAGLHLIWSLFSASEQGLAAVTSGTVLEWSVVPLSAVFVVIGLGTCAWLSRRLNRKLGLALTKTETLILAAFLFCLFRSGEHLIGFPAFYFRHLIDLVLFLSFGWFSWTVFFGKKEGKPSRVWWNLERFWLGVFLFWGLQPIPQFRDYSLHHWSFYVGPIELLRQGGRLLFDVPSQYGFLSILLPAAIPVPAFQAFHIALGLVLFAQAVLLFKALLQLPLKRYRVLWSGIVSLVLVYFLPGDHNDLGVLTFPNTSAYRFFPVILVATLLARREKTPRPWLALGFGFGCLWSFDSAVFCAGAWGYAWLAEGFAISQKPRALAEATKLLPRLVAPWLGVVGFIVVIELFYRVYFGLAPEWGAMREFSRVYAESFALSPIDPRSSFNLLAAFIALFAAYLLSTLARDPSRKHAEAFAYYGLVVATLTYFVARSEPINAVTLIALWLVAFYLSVRSVPLGEWKRPLLLAAFLFAVVFVPFSLPNPIKKNVGVAVKHWGRWLGAVPYERDKAETIALEAQRDKALPLAILTVNTFPAPPVTFRSFSLTPWLPTHPNEQFCILPEERRTVYLRRFMARHTVKRAQLIRNDKKFEPCLPHTLKVIGERYRLVESKTLPQDLLLETYELK